jgi:hypothetical protein
MQKPTSAPQEIMIELAHAEKLDLKITTMQLLHYTRQRIDEQMRLLRVNKLFDKSVAHISVRNAKAFI